MKLKNYSIKGYLKKNHIVRSAYYNLNFFIYSLTSFVLNILGVPPNLRFIRKALSYGINPNRLTRKLSEIIIQKDWGKHDIYLLVAILNALGYVNNGLKLLQQHSKLDKHTSTRVFRTLRLASAIDLTIFVPDVPKLVSRVPFVLK